MLNPSDSDAAAYQIYDADAGMPPQEQQGLFHSIILLE